MTGVINPGGEQLNPLLGVLGSTNGAPNSNNGSGPNDLAQMFGPNLWLSPTSGTGLNTSPTPSITANGTNVPAVKTRLNVGYINSADSVNGTVANLSFRILWNLSSTVPSGWWWLSYQWTNAAGGVIGSNQGMVSTIGVAITNYCGCLDVTAPPTGAVNLEILLGVANNAPSGTLSINSLSVYRVANPRTPLAVGWSAGAPNTSGGVFSIFQPLIDPATGLTSWVERQLGIDGVLQCAVNAGYAWPNGTTSWHWSPLDGTVDVSVPGPSTSRLGPPTQLHVGNNSHIMGVINGSGNQELRCNAHGGEVGRSGTYTTDFVLQYDIGDGVWRTVAAVVGLAHLCRRFQLIQHTVVTATTGETICNIDYTWTFYDDGTFRQDRTVTFLRAVAMCIWFVWMSSLNPASNGFYGSAQLGSGTPQYSADARPYLTTPIISSVAVVGSGTMPAKSYQLTALTPHGETLASVVVTAASGGASNTINFPAAQTGQTGWGVYDASGLLIVVPATTTSWSDTNAVAGIRPLPTVNTAWTGAQTQAAVDAQSAAADWAAWREAITGYVYTLLTDRTQILAQHPSATGLITETSMAPGSTCKIYNHLMAAAGGAIAGGNQASGYYPVTIPNGTVISNTSWGFFHLPKSSTDFAAEIIGRAVNAPQLAAVYPAT